MDKPTFRQRFQYWFDNRMAKGSLSLIKLLALVSLGVILLITAVILVFGLSEDGDVFLTFWDSMATLINAWMPYGEDGGAGYLIVTAIAALIGLLVTSVLIGIIASAIEEKITGLKHGDSEVLESDHTVVLGFVPGEYTLLQQLVLAAAGRPACIVVAGDTERDEMEQYLRDNLEKPKNVRVICRTVDILDPVGLKKCALAKAKTVIVSPMEDSVTVKVLLAATNVMRECGGHARLLAVVSRDEYSFPPSISERYQATTLQTYDILARIIAHSCTQPGLSGCFREILEFSGSELYTVTLPEAEGLRFSELLRRMENGVPAGLIAEGESVLAPPPERVIRAGEKILVFAENRDAVRLGADPAGESAPAGSQSGPEIKPGDVLIIGCNEKLRTVLHELPEDVHEVKLAGLTAEQIRDLRQDESLTAGPVRVNVLEQETALPAELETLAEAAAHIAILSDHVCDPETADMQTICRVLALRDIRARRGLNFNITAEMRRESNQRLLADNDGTDFIVASDVSSLVLAQLAESGELLEVFRELLTNEGCELLLKSAGMLGCTGEHRVADLRSIALARGYVLLGRAETDGKVLAFNRSPEEPVRLFPGDSLAVIGEK